MIKKSSIFLPSNRILRHQNCVSGRPAFQYPNERLGLWHSKNVKMRVLAALEVVENKVEKNYEKCQKYDICSDS